MLYFSMLVLLIVLILLSAGAESPDTNAEHKRSRAIKGAPLGSLFAQFCLHSLWFGNCNIRGMYDCRNAVGGGILLAV